AGERVGDASYGLEVARRGGGEAGLDDVHAEALELARDRELLLDVHRASGRLLAVAQGGVEDADVVGVGQDVADIVYRLGHRRLSPLSTSRLRGPRAARRANKKSPGAFASSFKVAAL